MMPAQIPVQVPAAKGKRPLRHLTASDKINAIQRFHDGESKASVARDIGVAESTFRGWCKKEEKLRHMSNTAAIDNNLKVDKSADKMNGDSDLAAAAALYGGPPEKRAKLGASLNFRNLSDPSKSEIALAASSPLDGLSQFSGMSNLNPAALGLSYDDISNLNLIAKLNNQSNIAGLSNSQNNGLSTVRPKQMSKRLTVKHVKKLQHKNPTLDNIGMGVDMIDQPKKPSAASLTRDTKVEITGSTNTQHQQIFGNMYSGMPGSSASPSRLSPGQQRQQTNILNALNSNTCWYLHRLKEIENAILNKSNCSTGNTPEDLAKLKKTELELKKESEVNGTSANSPLTSPKAKLSEGNTDRKAALGNILDNNNNDNVVSNESDCKGLLMTGLELADKFQQFLEAYHGDPTVTGFDLLQFRTLHNKLKKTAERIRIENT